MNGTAIDRIARSPSLPRAEQRVLFSNGGRVYMQAVHMGVVAPK